MVPFCIPTNNSRGLQFLHIFANTCFLFLRFSIVATPVSVNDTSLQFRFAFSLMVSDGSIFSCVCWPFVYVLWRNVYLDPLPIFSCSICLLITEFKTSYYRYKLLVRYMICKYLLPFSTLSFYCVDGFLQCS